MLEKLVSEAEQAVWESVVGRLQCATCRGFCWCVNRAAVDSQIPDFSESLAYSVFLSHSQHTQPPSLFTNFSQE